MFLTYLVGKDREIRSHDGASFSCLYTRMYDKRRVHVSTWLNVTMIILILNVCDNEDEYWSRLINMYALIYI